MEFLNPLFFAKVANCTFLAILFLQSGFDKVLDWKGNLSWLTGHFAKSPFKNSVPILLGIITLFECTAGLVSALGVLFLFVNGDAFLGILGIQLSGLSLLMLFFGQRMAKDYAGAATLVPYFILTLLGLYLFSLPV